MEGWVDEWIQGRQERRKEGKAAITILLIKPDDMKEKGLGL